MKPKTMILMIVAVACGLGASIMTSRLLADRKKEDNEPTVPVLIAKAKVLGWAPIKEPDKAFEVKQYPASLAPKGAIGDVEKMKAEKLNKTIEEGHLLVEADLLSKEQQLIEAQLKPGQRATAIKVNAQSLAGGFVFPGSRVDITLTTRSNSKATTKTILQHVLVMAVDAQAQRNPEMKHILGQTVTVAATPEEAGRLSLAGSLGDLQLYVKSPGDTARNRPVVIREEDLDRPPLSPGEKPDEAETVKTETPKLPTTALPELPKEEPKKEVVKEEPKKEEPKKEVVKEETAPPIKRHVMRIQTGGSVEKAVFLLGEKDPDEDDASGTTTTPADDKKKPVKVEEKKPAVPPAPAKAAPGPAKVGRTRTGN